MFSVDCKSTFCFVIIKTLSTTFFEVAAAKWKIRSDSALPSFLSEDVRSFVLYELCILLVRYIHKLLYSGERGTKLNTFAEAIQTAENEIIMIMVV
jgi:hypothetical protein